MSKFVNLCKKYDVTVEEINEEVNKIDFGKMVNVQVMLALCDLLTSGDID